MKHEWKVGDIYTILKYKSLHVIGLVSALEEDCIVGTDMCFTDRREFSGVDVDCYHKPEDLILLVPYRDPLEKTINEIYQTVEKVQG